MPMPAFIKWVGDEIFVDLIRAAFRGATSMATDGVKSAADKRIKPNDRLSQLNADFLSMRDRDTEHLRRRLHDAKSKYYENWLTKILCLAIYDVPGGDPKEMIKVLNSVAADEDQWNGFVELLDTDGFIENAQLIRSWLMRALRDAAEKIRACNFEPVSEEVNRLANEIEQWACGVEARARRRKRWF